MNDINFNREKLIKVLSDEFLEKINYSNKSSIGIFQSLHLICDRLNLWELKIILSLAENEPVTMDYIVQCFEDKISKSSIYRKISELITNNIAIKRSDNALFLSEELNAISKLAKIYKKIKEIHEEDK